MNARRCMLMAVMGFSAVFLTAGAARAQMNTDLRMKLGSSAGITQVDQFPDFVDGTANDNGGGNFQIELVLSNEQDFGPYFVGGVGVFGRTHKGTVTDPFLPTDVEYDAGGLSGTAGIGVAAGPNFNIEGRVELDLGSGSPTLSTPGVYWNSVQDGSYAAWNLIFGGYYTISKPGLQIGLELGAQSFVGNYQIWNGFSWDDADVKGSGGTINLVVGYRF